MLRNGLMGLSQVLATSMRNTENNIAANDDNDSRLNLGDEDNMVSGSNSTQIYQFQASTAAANREKFLRYRTRLFAAEYVFLGSLSFAINKLSLHAIPLYLTMLSLPCFKFI